MAAQFLKQVIRQWAALTFDNQVGAVDHQTRPGGKPCRQKQRKPFTKSNCYGFRAGSDLSIERCFPDSTQRDRRTLVGDNPFEAQNVHHQAARLVEIASAVDRYSRPFLVNAEAVDGLAPNAEIRSH